MFALSKAADLNYLVQGGQLHQLSLPFNEVSLAQQCATAAGKVVCVTLLETVAVSRLSVFWLCQYYERKSEARKQLYFYNL